ncbi:MAG: hypothetical protein V7707_02055 [Motiliproteus sp.]
MSLRHRQPRSGWPALTQPDANCVALISLWWQSPGQLLAWAQLPLRLVVEGVLGIRPAYAGGGGGGGGDANCELPDLLLEGDYGDWVWDVAAEATFTSPHGLQITYSDDLGVLP